VTVMYAGEVVESADVRTLFHRPRHPYTHALINCLPARAEPGPDGRRLVRSIPGTVASAAGATGCKFAPRCAHAAPPCHAAHPALESVEDGQTVRCCRWRDL
ncbi:MAG TPA: dipeptide ABC transporter ATP-binding protein DppD, partial [Beijerinckiaceae bacterium]|nr:dipeptide ABC transporter ATP-binding protein DppD [Beijerinckiaceae bacterium]